MNILVMGCGQLGAGLARHLSLAGHTITVVDNDPASFALLEPGWRGRSITGAGFDRDVLLRAGIERADALAAVSGSDDANVVVARLARQIFRVPRVVARVYDPRKAVSSRYLGIQVVAPVTWGVNRIAELLSLHPLGAIASLGDGAVDLVEIEVPALMAGHAVSELVLPGELSVVAITRGGKTTLPALGTVLQEGDLAHLAVLASSAGRLKSLLGLE